MSQALYDSLLEKWENFLDDGFHTWDSLISEAEADEQYFDDLVNDFCRLHKYSEKTKNLAFYEKWYDTFADEFYQRLEWEGVKIIHENPTKDDWDFGKKFKFENLKWKEV